MRKPAKLPPNQLTKETRADWVAANTYAKIGEYARASARAIEWACWKLGTMGVDVPANLKGEVSGNVVTFGEARHVYGYWTSPDAPDAPFRPQHVMGRKGSRARQVWVDEHDEFEPIGEPVRLPPHCQPVRWADRWHMAHQTGKAPSDCEMFGNAHYFRPDAAAMPGEDWDRMQAERLLDQHARHRQQDGDHTREITDEAHEMECVEKLAAYAYRDAAD
jgi:hypothetical protein